MKLRMRDLQVVAVGGALLGASTSVLATYISHGVLVDQPGLVLMVDGQDRNAFVSLSVNTRNRGASLDFGFMSGDTFSSLSGRWCGNANQVFAGAATVDFAVRSKGIDNLFGTMDDQIFRLSDPAHYANQYYAGKISPWKAANPALTDPYYRSVVLIWDVNHDGITDLKVMLQARKRFDGLRFAATPVPLPAAVWLLGSGLAGLAAFARRRKAMSSV